MRWDGMDGMGEKHDRHALIKAHTRARPESRWRAEQQCSSQQGLRAETGLTGHRQDGAQGQEAAPCKLDRLPFRR